MVVRTLGWPFLAFQGWESVVSGLHPEGGFGQPGEGWSWEGRGPRYSSRRRLAILAPWSIVRLINLVMLYVVFQNRYSEACSKQPVRPRETVHRFMQSLQKIKVWEEKNTKREVWWKRWCWFSEVNPPVP